MRLILIAAALAVSGPAFAAHAVPRCHANQRLCDYHCIPNHQTCHAPLARIPHPHGYQ